MLLLLMLAPSSSPDYIDVVMKDVAPPWSSPSIPGTISSGSNYNRAPSTSSSSPSSSSSSSPMRFTALHVTMIFVAILLCVIICAIPWDNIKCGGSSSSSNDAAEQSQSQNPNPSAHRGAGSGEQDGASPADEGERAAAAPASGLSKKMIKSFQLVRYGSSSLREKAESDGGGGGGGGCWTECMICLSDFRNGQMVRILPQCHHGFHRKCIEQWLHSHTSCPICRNALLVPDSPDKRRRPLPLESLGSHHQPPEPVESRRERHHHHQQPLESVGSHRRHHRHPLESVEESHHHPLESVESHRHHHQHRSLALESAEPHRHHYRHHSQLQRQDEQQQRRQQLEQVVVDVASAQEEEGDVDATSVDQDHSVYRAYVVISD